MHEKQELKQRVQSKPVCCALGRANMSDLRGCVRRLTQAAVTCNHGPSRSKL